MMFKVFSIAVFIIAVLSNIEATNVGYTGIHYWREYNGTVPEDAFIAGEDTVKGKVYIGQVFIAEAGLYPGALREGIVEINVPLAGAVTRKKSIKILCAPPENGLKWISTKCKQQTMLKRIATGYDFNFLSTNSGHLFVVRKEIEGESLIGQTTNYYKCPGFFVLNGTEYKTTSFDMLVYP